MTPELCDLLLARTDSKGRLEMLWKQSMFVNKFDGEAYRYYPIFKDFLVSQVSYYEQLELHSQASLAMAELELWDEAGYHAAKANNQELLEQIIVRAGTKLLGWAQVDTLVNWIEQLPKASAENNPTIAVYMATARFLTGHSTEAHYWISVARKNCPVELSGALMALEVIANSASRASEGSELAQATVAQVPDSNPVFKAGAYLTLGQAHLSFGQSDLALQAFCQAHQLAHNDGGLFMAILSLINMAYQLFVLGRCGEAVQECRSGQGRCRPNRCSAKRWDLHYG